MRERVQRARRLRTPVHTNATITSTTDVVIAMSVENSLPLLSSIARRLSGDQRLAPEKSKHSEIAMVDTVDAEWQFVQPRRKRP